MAGEVKQHVWHYSANGDDKYETHEFPLAVKQQTASNLIAQRMGLRELPGKAVVASSLPTKSKIEEGKKEPAKS